MIKVYTEDLTVNKYQHYAGRFAAKEADFKAVSGLLSDKYSLSWKNIEITNDSKGRPKLNFISIDRKVEKELKKIIDSKRIEVSLSHEREFAIAFAIVT